MMNITSFTLLHPSYGPLPCTAPFSLYSVLLEHGKIPDPFYRDNEYALTALSEQDYTFEGTFTLSPEEAAKEHQLLVLEGIDTVADLYLNGAFIGHTESMHRIFRFDVGSALRTGDNRLQIHFASPLKYIRDKQARHFTWGQSGTSDGFGHIRKASSMFSWDWAPLLPDMGIYRPIRLESFDTDQIQDVEIRQRHPAYTEGTFSIATGEKVTLSLTLTSRYGVSGLTPKFRLVHPDGRIQEVVGKTMPRNVAAGIPSTCDMDEDSSPVTTATIEIDHPELWWPHGYGKQPLYTLICELYQGETLLDVCEKRIGLRTLTVSTAHDEYGQEFCFVVNGQKIFAMGADYVPEDSLVSRITRKTTEKLLNSCVEANFNCIRVWGGGYYPSDDFYDLCDEKGLLVWQDFMFACVNVRLSAVMKENIRQELIFQIKRLRHHASLGLFCGNNEMELAVLTWEGCNDSLLAKSDYLELYERMMPDLCDALCPDVYYWPSSPSSGGGFDKPDDESRGDAHYWGAWHGSIPFESYRSYYFRFLSEFGFEAFPNYKTIQSFSLPEDENPFSPIMESHQKCLSGNTKILTYLSDKYLYPFDFRQLIYASQLLQLDAIRYGVEHYRRFRGRCMGTVYWQLNDCWPVASWASVDYYGRWKALMYGAKRFFAPVLLSAHEKGFDVTLNVSNETLEKFQGSVHWWIQDAAGKMIHDSELIPVNLPALSTLDVTTLYLKDILQGHEKDYVLAYELLDAGEKRISSSTLLFVRPKQFHFQDPKLQATWKPVSSAGDESTEKATQYQVTIQAAAYAKHVEIDFNTLDARFSDNYFDITTGTPITLTATFDHPVSLEEVIQDCTLRSVYNIGR